MTLSSYYLCNKALLLVCNLLLSWWNLHYVLWCTIRGERRFFLGGPVSPLLTQDWWTLHHLPRHCSFSLQLKNIYLSGCLALRWWRLAFSIPAFSVLNRTSSYCCLLFCVFGGLSHSHCERTKAADFPGVEKNSITSSRKPQQTQNTEKIGVTNPTRGETGITLSISACLFQNLETA